MLGLIKSGLRRMAFWPRGYQPQAKPDSDKQDLATEPRTGGYQSVGYHRWGLYPRKMPVFTFITIQEMLLDPTIRLGLAMRAAPLASLEWGWKDGDTWNSGIQSENEEVSKFVERQLKRIWSNDLDAVLSAQVWGWSCGEVTYRMTDSQSVEVDRLLPRHANDCRARTRESKLVGCRVLRCPGIAGGYVDLEFPKCWWHAFKPESGMHYGLSALLGAYSPWFDKWMDGGALDVRRLFMHKDAYAGADLSYPEGAQYIPGKGEVPNRDIAREIVEQLASGGVTTFPSDPGPDGKNRWTLTRAQVASNPGHILQYPKDLDVEILRGLEIADDVLAVDGSGSWAGKRVPMAAFYAGLDCWASAVVRDLDEQVIRPLVKINFGNGIDYQIGHKPLAEQAMEQQQEDGGDKQQAGGGDSYSDLFGGGGGQQPPGKPPGGQPPARMSLQTEAEAVVSAARRIIRMRADPDRGGERWITIGGRKGEDGEHAGGFPCKINADGEILAGGPKGLRGKKVSEVYKHFKRMRNTPQAKEKRYQTTVKKQAKTWKISPQEYQQFADEVHKEKMAHHTARESAKAAARKAMGVTAADIGRWEEQGLDYSSPKLSKYQWDVQGQRLASQFPDLGWGEGYSETVNHGGHDAKLWDLLKEGKVDPPSRNSDEFHADVDEYLQYLASQTPGGLDDPPDADDTDFNFGALADDDDAFSRFGLDGPQEGDRKQAADGGWLVLRSGHWTKEGDDSPSQTSSPKQQPPIEITGDEFGQGIPDSQIRDHALAYAQQHFQGKAYVNQSSGKTIKVSKRGIKKTLNHLPDARPALAMAKLPEILESAEYIRSDAPRTPDPNVRMYHYFKAELTIRGKQMVTAVKVFEDANGDWYYDQHVTPK